MASGKYANMISASSLDVIMASKSLRIKRVHAINSTCSTAVSSNNILKELTNSNMDKILYIKPMKAKKE